MKWFYVFTKSLREQFRDYWILILTLVFAPFFVFMYYLMSETGNPEYHVVLVNRDRTTLFLNAPLNLGDTLVKHLASYAEGTEDVFLKFHKAENRESGMALLTSGEADLMLVLPENLTACLTDPDFPARDKTIELVGDITDVNYIVSAVWTEELVNRFVLEASGTGIPIGWKETALGHSGQRSEFELYVPGLMIFAIIMMMFSASATLVREPEAGTLERLKISRLGTFQYLAGVSLVQLIIGMVSLLLTMGTAMALGYTLIPGTLPFILLTGTLTSLSMISFSLIVASICRSVKDVAIIGTFPLMLMMFFSGAFFPLGGGRLFTMGRYTLHLNDLLSPTWAVDALNKVLIKGQHPRETFTDMLAILVLAILYFIIGLWAFRQRHMKAA